MDNYNANFKGVDSVKTETVIIQPTWRYNMHPYIIAATISFLISRIAGMIFSALTIRDFRQWRKELMK